MNEHIADTGRVAVDGAALAETLRAAGEPVQGSLELRRVGHGRSNLTYLATDRAGRHLVVRRPPLGPLLPSAHDVAREARIMAALWTTDVPVPRVLLVADDPAVSDAAVVVMEHVAGAVIDDARAAVETASWMRRAVGGEMAAALASIHRVDLRATGLDALASHGAYAPRQLRRWSAQWQSSKLEENPRLDELTTLLTQLAPSTEQPSLVHGDFHIRNVILGDGGDVRAVLDWELATLGDPLADLGTMLAYWGLWLDPVSGRFDGTRVPGYAGVEEVCRDYLRESGVDRTDVDYWHAFALWKIAIIAEGVRGRATRSADPEAVPSASITSTLIDRAWQVVAQAKLAG